MCYEKAAQFQVNRLEYLEEPMTLYGTYSADRIEVTVDVTSHLHQ